MEIDKIKRVVLGRASEEERKEVQAWVEESKQRSRLLQDAKMFYGSNVPDEQEERRRIKRMWRRIPLSREKRRRVIGRRWAAVAACMVAVLGIALWMQQANDGNKERIASFYPVHSNGVRLILPDGSMHEITAATTSTLKIPGFKVDENIMIQEERNLDDASGVEYTEIVVPRGGEYSLMLADGTNVILNSETRIRFPNSFAEGEERKIFLSGEAYFNVIRDEHRPFLVEFLGGTVRVLGTRFNVKAYMGQNPCATLESGKVEVLSGRDSVVLQPGELCEIAANDHTLSVREADVMSVLAWKNGEFVFKNALLGEIMDELSRWYDTEIVYNSSDLQGMKLHVYMDRAKTLEEALGVISKMVNITYNIEGKKVIINNR